MSAISGTRRSMKELVDGTIRVSIDIDPIHRDAFFSMFGKIDMPVAIAPLVADFERHGAQKGKNSTVSDEKHISINDEAMVPQPSEKGGQLAKLAGMWCASEQFWKWAATKTHNGIFWYVYSEDMAADFIREICEVESRAELDHNPEAAHKFHTLIREPYLQWQKDNGLA